MAVAAPHTLLAWMREHRAEMVALLRRLAQEESPSLEPERQRGPFRLLASELAAIGYDVRAARGDQVGDHLYARPRERSRHGRRQLLIGHMDTVWPVGTLAQMPIREEGGVLYGPGVADMKGGLVVIVFALRALHELGLTPSVTPVVFVNTDEEIGSLDSSRFIRLLARGAERAFVLESGEGATGQLKIARKGLGRFTVTVHGRSSHAGADFDAGISAILELSHQVQRLFALNDPARGVTVNVGTIDGGLRPNVVAPTASAVVDIRVPTADAARRLERAVRGLEPVTEGATIDVHGRFGRPPMEPLPRNRELLAAAIRLGHEVGLTIGDAGLVGGGSDANTTSLFTGTLDGLGPIGEGSHAIDERVDITRMPERVALLALLLLEPLIRRQRKRHRRRSRAAPAATRVALLGTEGSSTNGEIVAAWQELGIDAAIVAPAGIGAWLGPADVVLGRLDILPTIDGVEPGLLDLLWLERRGSRVLNTAFALVAAHDKLRTGRLLSRAGIPQPRTQHLRPRGALPGIDLPVVVKPRLGSWGAEVYRCDTQESFERCVDRLRAMPWFQRQGALVQELIPPAGHDLRILAAGGAPVGAIRRTAAPGEWRTNISLGGTPEPVEPPADACALGVAAADAIGADFVGVDLLPVGTGHIVIEINGAADFDLRYSLPGHDVYRDAALALGLFPGRTAPSAILARRA